MNVSKTPSAVAGDNAAEVSRYYNNSQWIYDLLWMNKKNLAMHYGFWDKKTASRADALLNVNEYVARDLDIRAADVVLDAGCGVGGTAIWMAEERGARVTGLTITQKQVALARKHISRRGVRALVNVELADFCRTGLPSQSFDKIYAIESVCHAPEKASFLTEAFRLLKPGGGLAVYDYFLAGTRSALDEQDYETYCRGWVMPGLPTMSDFEGYARGLGFVDIRCRDCTSLMLRSARIMEKMARAFIPVDLALNLIKVVSDEDLIGDRATIVQRRLFEDGVLFYGAFCAEKP